MSKFGQKFNKWDGHIPLLITWLKLFGQGLLEEGKSSREVPALVVLASLNMSASTRRIKPLLSKTLPKWVASGEWRCQSWRWHRQEKVTGYCPHQKGPQKLGRILYMLAGVHKYACTRNIYACLHIYACSSFDVLSTWQPVTQALIQWARQWCSWPDFPQSGTFQVGQGFLPGCLAMQCVAGWGSHCPFTDLEGFKLPMLLWMQAGRSIFFFTYWHLGTPVPSRWLLEQMGPCGWRTKWVCLALQFQSKGVLSFLHSNDAVVTVF